jgi:hypothetical protein
LCLLVAAAGCDRRPPAEVDRLDVLLAVLPDGSLEAQESWVVRFGDPASSSFTRMLPSGFHDGIADTQALVDGQLLTDTGAQRAVVQEGRRPRVVWHIPPITNGKRIFQLRYRAANVLALRAGRARLEWPVLGGGHGWTVREAQITLTAPPGHTPAEPPGMSEAGWTVAARPDGIRGVRADIAPSESATVVMELGRDGLTLTEPAWQFHHERAAEFAPAFASAAVFIVIVGISVLVMIRAGLISGGPAGYPGAARGLRISGLVCVALGVALAVAVRLVLDSFGPWALGVPASVIAVGLLFLVAAAYFSRSPVPPFPR